MAITFSLPSGTQTGTFAISMVVDDGNVLASIADTDFSVVSATTGVTFQLLDQSYNTASRSTRILVAVIPPDNATGMAQLRVAANAFMVRGSSATFPSAAQTSASVEFDTDGTPAFSGDVVSANVETNGDFDVRVRFSEMIVGRTAEVPLPTDFGFSGASVTGLSLTTLDFQNYRLLGTAVQTAVSQTLTITMRARRVRPIAFSAGQVVFTGGLINQITDITDLTIPATGTVPRPTDTTTPSVTWTPPTGTQTGQFTLGGTWSTPVSNFSSGDIGITPSGASSSGFTYDASTGIFSLSITPPTTGSGTIVATIAANRVTPANTEQSQSIPYAQTTAPPAPTTPTVAWTTPSNIQYTAFTVSGVWSQAVTGFDSSNLVVAPGGIANFTQSGNRFSFTVIPPQSGSGSIVIGVDSTGIAPAPSVASQSVRYAQPTGTPTTPAITWRAPTESQTGQFTLTGTWSLPVLGFSSSDVQVSSGAVVGNFNYDASTRQFSVDVTPPSTGSGTLEVFVAINAVTPANVRQAVSIPFNQPSFITWTHPFRTQYAAFQVTGRWNVPVSDFTENDIQVSTGTEPVPSALSNFIYPYDGDSQQFQFTVTPPSGQVGALTISVPANAVTPANADDSISVPFGSVVLSAFPTRRRDDDRPPVVFDDARARTNFLYAPIHYLRGRNAYAVRTNASILAPEVQDNDYRTYSTETDFIIQTFGRTETTPTVVDYIFVKSSGVASYSLSAPSGSGTGVGFTNRSIPAYTSADGITVDTFYRDTEGRVIQHDFFPLGNDRLITTEVELNFTGTAVRIYEIMLMQGILVVTPERLFNAIEHTNVANSIAKTNIKGDNFTIRSLASRSKWSSRYTAFFTLETEIPIETLIDVIERNKNFVFVPEWNRFPTRVYLSTWGTSTFPARYRSRYIHGGTLLDFEVLEL